MNPIQRLIQETTGAPAEDITQIEDIMRAEIFHSTLDWQTREQLIDAARKAFALLKGNPEVYEFRRIRALATIQEMRAASRSAQ